MLVVALVWLLVLVLGIVAVALAVTFAVLGVLVVYLGRSGCLF